MVKEDKEFNAIFARQLKRHLEACKMTKADLAEALGVGTSTVSSWCNGSKCPRMNKVDRICDVLHCRRNDLISDVEPFNVSESDVLATVQRMLESRELKMLYEVAKDSKPQDVMLAVDFLTRIRQAEENNGKS